MFFQPTSPLSPLCLPPCAIFGHRPVHLLADTSPTLVAALSGCPSSSPRTSSPTAPPALPLLQSAMRAPPEMGGGGSALHLLPAKLLLRSALRAPPEMEAAPPPPLARHTSSPTAPPRLAPPSIYPCAPRRGWEPTDPRSTDPVHTFAAMRVSPEMGAAAKPVPSVCLWAGFRKWWRWEPPRALAPASARAGTRSSER